VCLIAPGHDPATTPADRLAEARIRSMPVLGLQQLAAVLWRERGIEATLLNGFERPRTVSEFLAHLRRERPSLCGISATTPSRALALELVRSARAALPDALIAVGGPDHPAWRRYLEAGADAVAIGEGEHTILQLVDHARGGAPALEAIPGIAHAAPGVPTIAAEPAAPVDLDALPFPFAHETSVGRYHDWRLPFMRLPFATVMTSRGCFGRCSFCALPGLYPVVRHRSVETVLAEVDDLVGRLGVRSISFLDDAFGIDPRWLERFCSELAARRYPLRWVCTTHPVVFARDAEAKLQALARAGCALLIVGVQSADPTVLRGAGRDPGERALVRRAIPIARRAGMSVALQFVLGLPGETPESLRANPEFALEVGADFAHFNPLSLIEGSALHQEHAGRPEAVCGMEPAALNRWSAWSLRRFYAHPRTIARLARLAIREPAYPLRLAAMLTTLRRGR